MCNTAQRVNVQSQQPPSELLYLVVDDVHATRSSTASRPCPSGWTPLPPGPAGGGLDFIRGNLFDPATMRPLPPDAEGPDNDLADLLDHYVLRAIDAPDARVHLFGEPWSRAGGPDTIFGFAPGRGVHDIHMNQGNSAGFAKDDGPWQDGGLIIRLPQPDRWVAVFLAFQSQAWHTDDITGHAAGRRSRDGSARDPATSAVACASWRAGQSGRARAGARDRHARQHPRDAVSLAGWSIADRLKAATRRCPT